MTWLDSGGQRSKFKITPVCRGGEGMHVDAGGVEVHLLILLFICVMSCQIDTHVDGAFTRPKNTCSVNLHLCGVLTDASHLHKTKNYSLICTTIRVVFLNKRSQYPSVSKYIHKKIPTPSQRRPLSGREKVEDFIPTSNSLICP